MDEGMLSSSVILVGFKKPSVSTASLKISVKTPEFMFKSKVNSEGRITSGMNLVTWRASLADTSTNMLPAVSVSAPSATARKVLPLAVPKPAVCLTMSRSSSWT